MKKHAKKILFLILCSVAAFMLLTEKKPQSSDLIEAEEAEELSTPGDPGENLAPMKVPEKKAHKQIKKPVKIEAEHAWREKVKKLLERGDIDAVIALLSEELEGRPGDRDILKNIAIYEMTYRRNHEAAISYLESGLEKNPDSELIDILLQAYERADTVSDGVRFFEDLSASFPDNGEYSYGLAEALRKSGRISESLEHYRKATLHERSPANAYVGLAAALEYNLDFDGASAAFQEALSDENIDPYQKTEIKMRLSQSLIAGGHYEAGKKIMKELEEEAKKMPQAAETTEY